MKSLRGAVVLVAVAMLSACSTANSPFLQTAKAMLGIGSADDRQLNPEYSYLQVSLSGRTAFVVLGDIDKHPDGPIEVYYGSGGMVLRLQRGRLYGLNGMPTEWRSVSIQNAPTWTVAAQAQRAEWMRTRDVMPGYRYGIREKIAVTTIPAPRKPPLQEGTVASGLTWFEERVIESDVGSASDHLPPARYAVSFADQRETVVYGEQCLAPEVCLTWQPWTVRKR